MNVEIIVKGVDEPFKGEIISPDMMPKNSIFILRVDRKILVMQGPELLEKFQQWLKPSNSVAVLLGVGESVEVIPKNMLLEIVERL